MSGQTSGASLPHGSPTTIPFVALHNYLAGIKGGKRSLR